MPLLDTVRSRPHLRSLNTSGNSSRVFVFSVERVSIFFCQVIRLKKPEGWSSTENSFSYTNSNLIPKRGSSEGKSTDRLSPGCVFKSDFYEIKTWDFDFTRESGLNTGYNDCLCIMFIRNGNFLFDLSKQLYEMHTGHVLIDKPDYKSGCGQPRVNAPFLFLQ